jgi:hypothetical protein
MVTRERATTEYLGDIVRFSPVHIPRFVTWGEVGQILFGVDPLFLNG